MTVKINDQERRIGLAPSGGGFRAAGFHVGVMRKLQWLGNPRPARPRLMCNQPVRA
jgi:hypothetical protein